MSTLRVMTYKLSKQNARLDATYGRLFCFKILTMTTRQTASLVRVAAVRVTLFYENIPVGFGALVN